MGMGSSKILPFGWKTEPHGQLSREMDETGEIHKARYTLKKFPAPLLSFSYPNKQTHFAVVLPARQPAREQ